MQKNAFMQFARRANLSWWLCLLPFVWSPVLSDSFTITRVGPCDWGCYDENHAQLSCHQGWRKATESCANRALSDGKVYFVYSTQYRIEANIGTTDPPIDPPPDPAPPSGEIHLSWTAPTHNEDGSLIPPDGPDALDGYELWMSTTGSDTGYELLVDIEDETRLEFFIIGANPGTYWFKGKAYNNAGERSRFSGWASKVVE